MELYHATYKARTEY